MFKVLALSLMALLVGCSNPPYPRGDIKALFGDATAPTSVDVSVQGHILRTMQVTGKSDAPMLLFVHGSPGDWKAWADYLKAPELAHGGTRVAMDRPGFGQSQPGQLITDLRAQAGLLAGLIPEGKKAIVIGHSLGGPLAAWMAIDHPSKVCGAVSVAGSLSGDLEAPRWYNLAASLAPVQWVIRKEMTWSNREMMALQGELFALRAAWPRLQTPFTLIQGGKDSLVDPRTADEVEALAPKAWLRMQRLPNESHFVLWEKPELVTQAILQMPCLQAAK